jgi:hypothetical protein
MTHRNAARDADVLGRWRILAEQRLEHLTEMFESGRWRRYHSEQALLENIKEAKFAVATWRELSARQDIGEKSVAAPAAPAAQSILIRALAPAPVSAPEPLELPLVPAETDFAAGDEAPAEAVDISALEQARDLALIEERYPLLRNRM